MFCGIDVAKRKHVFTVMDANGQSIQPPTTITNDRRGFDTLLSTLSGLDSQSPLVGLEATGHYWLALYDDLTRHGYTVIVLNPLQVSAYRRSGIRKRKTDTLDAWWIADFIRISREQPALQSPEKQLQLRELTRFRAHLTEHIGDLKRKILSIIDRVFPEYETVFSNPFIQSSRRVLAEAVTAQDIADFDLSELTDLLHRASRGRFGEQKAQILQEKARQSIGISFLKDAVHFEMRCLLAQLDLLETQRQDADAAIDTLMASFEQYLTTIPGVGSVTAATLFAEIGDVHRFSVPDKLVAYAGIDATVFQTGQFEGSQQHMSKRGSPYLRMALWQAASMAIQYDPELKAYYHKKRQEGKHHGTALGAVCRKLLIRIYVILKQNRPYVVH
jgi:transposase